MGKFLLSSAFKKKKSHGCLSCLIWLGVSASVIAVVVVMLSRLAFSFIIGIIQRMFDFLRDFLVAAVSLIGNLPGWLAMPMGLVLLCGAAWFFWRRYQDRQWRDLECIREEYEPLARLLKKKGLKTYLAEIERLKLKMFQERDNVEELRILLADELPKIEDRLTEITLESQHAREEDRQEWRGLMKTLVGNSARLRQKQDDLRKFDLSKTRLASEMNCLRQRFNDVGYDDIEVRKIMKGIESVSFLADVFDQPSSVPEEPQPGPPKTPEGDREGR